MSTETIQPNSNNYEGLSPEQELTAINLRSKVYIAASDLEG